MTGGATMKNKKMIEETFDEVVAGILVAFALAVALLSLTA